MKSRFLLQASALVSRTMPSLRHQAIKRYHQHFQKRPPSPSQFKHLDDHDDKEPVEDLGPQDNRVDSENLTKVAEGFYSYDFIITRLPSIPCIIRNMFLPEIPRGIWAGLRVFGLVRPGSENAAIDNDDRQALDGLSRFTPPLSLADNWENDFVPAKKEDDGHEQELLDDPDSDDEHH